MITGSYNGLLKGLVELLEQARRASARAVNAVMTATYWEIGRRIVEYEQKGERRAAYGQALLAKLGADLSVRYGRGFSERNLEKMRLFYLSWRISPTLSARSQRMLGTGTASRKSPTPSAKSGAGVTTSGATIQPVASDFGPTRRFPLPWSHYVRLLSVEPPKLAPSTSRKPSAAAGPSAN